MDRERLQQLAIAFALQLDTTTELQNHMADHRRRSARVKRLLAPEHIPQLTEEELRELCFDSDAFGFWDKKEWEFNNRLQKVGLEGMRQALLELMTRAERGLTPQDLREIWDMRGLGTLLSTEFLAYYYPDRYWTYSSNVTLPALQKLGDDVKAQMPHGQKSNPYVYLALEPRLAEMRAALAAAGLSDVDNLVADIFLWWVNQELSGSSVGSMEDSPLTLKEPELPEVDPESLDIRQDPAKAQQIIESLLPDPESRLACLNVMADYILAAHRHSPATWEVTLFPNLVRLNIGSIQSVVVSSQSVYLVLDGKALTEADRDTLAQQGHIPGQVYKTVSDTCDVQVPAMALQNILPVVQKAYPTLVQRAFPASKRTPYYQAHSPGVIAYLRNALGRAIPDPDYGIGDTPSEPRPVSRAPFGLAAVLSDTLAGEGLYFTPWQIATFYTALQTKGFVILSGISGTGKTKLAQAFAAALPQPAQREVATADDVIAITVQPYMRKYGRLIIPKSATRLFDPPPPGEHQEVHLQFERKSQACRLVHAAYGNSDYLSLLLRGQVRPWFSETFAEGSTVVLQPELDKNDALTGFRIGTPEDWQPTPPVRAETGQPNLLFVPVRTDWRDSRSLLGYYNPLTGTYEWTPFLRFLLRAAQSYRAGDGLAWFVLLDEMNLARVEYYFADLLSVLESGRDAGGWTREPLRLLYPDDAEGDLPPKELRLPPNLYVIGTVNVDETTHAFSPKVLDRAFTLELTEADFDRYPAVDGAPPVALDPAARQALLAAFTADGRFVCIDKPAIAAYVAAHPAVREQLCTLNALLRPYDLHFGYRVFDEIVTFLHHAGRHGLYGAGAAFDAAVLMKVLPKFHGSRGQLEAPLKAVLAWCVDPVVPAEAAVAGAFRELETGDDVMQTLGNLEYRYPRTAARVRRMVWALCTHGFAAFG